MITEDDLRSIARGMNDIMVERSRVGQVVGAGRDGERRGMEWAWALVCALAGQDGPHVKLHQLRSNVACTDVVICLRCGKEHCPVAEACNWRREDWNFAPTPPPALPRHRAPFDSDTP